MIYNNLDSGEIRHQNYRNNEDLWFTIPTDCEMVDLVSSSFDTEEPYDYVTISGLKYDGSDTIRVLIPSTTIVHFHSDRSETKKGFVLKWTCVRPGKPKSKTNQFAKKISQKSQIVKK